MSVLVKTEDPVENRSWSFSSLIHPGFGKADWSESLSILFRDVLSICSVCFWYIHLPYIYIVTHVFVVVIHIGMSIVMIMILVA